MTPDVTEKHPYAPKVASGVFGQGRKRFKLQFIDCDRAQPDCREKSLDGSDDPRIRTAISGEIRAVRQLPSTITAIV